MEKRVFCQLNGNRKVIGILRGYDVRIALSLFDKIILDVVRLRVALCCHAYGCARLARDNERRKLTRRRQVFMNIVLDEAFEEKAGGEKVAIGMVVRLDNSISTRGD